jgi:hypothetical protein
MRRRQVMSGASDDAERPSVPVAELAHRRERRDGIPLAMQQRHRQSHDSSEPAGEPRQVPTPQT